MANAVTVATFFGLKPRSSISGEIRPPPPTPSSPDMNPARNPTNAGHATGRSSRYCEAYLDFLKKSIINPEKTKKEMKHIITNWVGIRCPTYAPTGAMTVEDMMMGSPSLKSRRFSLMFESVAPARLSVFTKSPVGRARGNGTPNHVNVGIRISAEPTPPKAKMKLNTKEQAVINMMVVIITPFKERAPSSTELNGAYLVL